MRFILGLIIGVALTVGAAWVHDSGDAPPPPPVADATAPLPSAARTNIVNWEVVEALERGLRVSDDPTPVDDDPASAESAESD